MKDQDQSAALVEAVRDACARNTALQIRGGGTKGFLGRESKGSLLSTAEHQGVLSYDPSELVLRARSGTLLGEIEALLSPAPETDAP